MPDRIVKPDTGNDLVLQNDDASAKIEINEAGTIVATPSIQTDNIKIDGNAITSENTNGNIDLTPNGTGEVNISKVDIDSGTIDGTDVTVGAGKTLDVSAGTLTSSTAQKQAIVQAGPGSGTLDVSSGTFTTSSAQKQAIVQAGPGSGTLDVSSGTFTTSTAQKQAIIDGASANQSGVKTAINASGSAPIYACRAWVNFDGSKDTSGSGSTSNTNRLINGSGNVTSVLRNGQGTYTITFSTAMQDDNYCALCSTVNRSGASGVGYTIGYNTSDNITPSTYSTTSLQVSIKRSDNQDYVDPLVYSVAIFR